jgi:hypothetical protein
MTFLWAQAADPTRTPRQPTFDWSTLWPWVALAAGAVVVGISVIVIVDRWRRRPVQHSPSVNEQLSEFQALYERGELSREEYDRIRSLLGQRLRREMDVPAAPAAEGTPSPTDLARRRISGLPGPASEDIQPRPPSPGDPGA